MRNYLCIVYLEKEAFRANFIMNQTCNYEINSIRENRVLYLLFHC